MANDNWTDVNGNWEVGTLWGPIQTVPTAADAATLGGTISYDVTFGVSQTTPESVGSLFLTDPAATLDLTTGSALLVGASLVNDGTIQVEANSTLEVPLGQFANNGSLSFASGSVLLINGGAGATAAQLATAVASVAGEGATIEFTGTLNNTGGTIDLSAAPFAGLTFDTNTDIVGGTLVAGTGVLTGSPTLDGVSVVGPLLLDSPGQYITIVDGSTFPSIGSGVTFDGPGASVKLGDAEYLNNITLAVGPDAAGTDELFGDFVDPVTIGANALITVAGHGTLVPGAQNEFLIDGITTLVNQGTISVGQNAPAIADFFAMNSFANTGTLVIGSSATLEIDSNAMTDTGPILLGANGFFGLGETLTTAQMQSLIGDISGASGTIGLDGTIDNSGAVINATTEPDQLSISGVISGGTIIAPAAANVLGVGFSGSLVGLTYEGALDLPAISTNFNLSNVTFAGATGTGSATITVANSYDALAVNQGSLDNVNINIEGSPFEIDGGTSLVLGSHFSLNSPGNVDLVASTLTNAGTLSAQGAGDAILLIGDTLINSGTVAVGAGGTLALGLGNGVSTLSVVNSGEISIGAGGTVLVGDVETTAQLLATLATIVVAGNNTVDLTGTLINTGATLAVGSGALIGNLILEGDIVGGTTTGTITTVGGTFNDVTELANAAPCFCAGTHILTPTGPRAVDLLHVGDLVMTHSGTPVEITWIGQRQVDLRRHPKPENVRPVRIRAGAFAPTVPARDLLVSPDHAIFIANPGEPGGVLVPARYLINGATVVQDANCPRAHYFHVELPAHDVLLAEGLPTESYLDTGNRDQFAGAAVPALHPDFTPRFWADACAPLCLSGPAVARTRLALLVRAEQLGYRRERVELSLQVGSRRLLPAIIRNDIVSFVLPAGTRMVRLTTRVAAPADTDHKSNDHRQLGVAIAGILFNGCSLALDGEAIGEGFYPPEGGWRWTNGDACLFLPAVATRRSLVLNLRVTGYATCWTAPSSLTVKQKKRS